MSRLKSICVFCGSSDGKDVSLLKEASLLGKTFADRNISLVYGGAKIGVMGRVADAVLSNNGKAVGVIPEFLKVKEVVHLELSELIITNDMHQRKMKMQELSDGFITLPGGFGTLEELFEVLTWSQLALHKKPVGLLNSNGFYDHLLSLLANMVTAGFLKQENYDILLVDTTIEGLLHKMENFKAAPNPKWLKSTTSI